MDTVSFVNIRLNCKNYVVQKIKISKNVGIKVVLLIQYVFLKENHLEKSLD